MPERVTPPHNEVAVLGRFTRSVSAEVLTHSFFPIDINRNLETEDRIGELVNQGYGIIEMTNHWGLIEMPSILEYNFKNPHLRKLPHIAPYASHMFKETYAQLGKPLKIELYRTRTKDSDEHYEKHPEEKPANYNELNNIFARRSASNLSKGGLVLLSPQGKRDSFLNPEVKQNIIAPFLSHLARSRIDFDRLAFLAIGTGPKGAKSIEDYESLKDTTWKNKHPRIQVRVGNIYTYYETGLPRNIHGIIDEAHLWAMNELKKIVPESYLPKK